MRNDVAATATNKAHSQGSVAFMATPLFVKSNSTGRRKSPSVLNVTHAVALGGEEKK